MSDRIPKTCQNLTSKKMDNSTPLKHEVEMCDHPSPRWPDEPLSRELCVWLIRNIPDLLMEHRHDILLSFSDRIHDGGILEAARQQYRNMAAWLEYYLLDRNEALPELVLTHKMHYKPLAERAMAFYRLAQELYPRLAWAQEQNLRPLNWMLQCEVEICETALKNSYYQPTVEPVGKSERYRIATEYYQLLEDLEKIQFRETGLVSAIEALEMGAYRIAKSDSNFENDHYRVYCQTQRRLFRSIRDSPLLGVVLRPDGRMKPLGRGQGRRGKNK